MEIYSGKSGSGKERKVQEEVKAIKVHTFTHFLRTPKFVKNLNHTID